MLVGLLVIGTGIVLALCLVLVYHTAEWIVPKLGEYAFPVFLLFLVAIILFGSSLVCYNECGSPWWCN